MKVKVEIDNTTYIFDPVMGTGPDPVTMTDGARQVAQVLLRSAADSLDPED